MLVVYDPGIIGYDELLSSFWEGHNPTQDFRQGFDVGSQYRSLIIATTDVQLVKAQASRRRREALLSLAGDERISTQIEPASTFYYAEGKHQQYIAKYRGG